jgi:hypothetical protein
LERLIKEDGSNLIEGVNKKKENKSGSKYTGSLEEK